MEQISNMINPKKCVPTHIIVKCLKTEGTKSQKQGQGSTVLPVGSRLHEKGGLKPIISAHTSKGPRKTGANELHASRSGY